MANGAPLPDDAYTPPIDAEHERVGWMRRVYALVPIVIVLFLSYKAVEYLVVTLLVPYEPPAQITQIPTRLTQEAWRQDPENWLGQNLAEQPRVPLAHYHRIDGWFQPDARNDCTASDCHAPMPHAQNKATRAFLNMHATSMHCGVCHLATDANPLPLVWYDLQTGAPTDPPALLRLHDWLVSDEHAGQLAEPTAEVQRELVRLAREAAAQSDNDPALVRVAEGLGAARFSSPAFQTAIDMARQQVPLHFRGEYGAKLALRNGVSGPPILGHTGGAAAAVEFRARAMTIHGAEREALLQRVHPQRRTPVLHCTQCHVQEHSLVDMGAVGYTEARIKSLYQSWIFRAIENIAEGRPLYLPGFVVPERDETP